VRAQPFSWDAAGRPFFAQPIGIKTPLLVPKGELPTTKALPTNGWAALEVWTSKVTNLSSLKQASISRPPDLTRLVAGLELPQNSGDNYGARLLGYVQPGTSGSYIFYLDSSNPAELEIHAGS